MTSKLNEEFRKSVNEELRRSQKEEQKGWVLAWSTILLKWKDQDSARITFIHKLQTENFLAAITWTDVAMRAATIETHLAYVIVNVMKEPDAGNLQEAIENKLQFLKAQMLNGFVNDTSTSPAHNAIGLNAVKATAETIEFLTSRLDQI